MKKFLFAGLSCLVLCGAAMAGYSYTETETVTTWERVSFDAPCNGCAKRAVSSRDVVRPVEKKPCAKKAAAPVRVKTHTEVIDHYQVYQPVTVYQPMGTEIQRRVVPVKYCGKCN